MKCLSSVLYIKFLTFFFNRPIKYKLDCIFSVENFRFKFQIMTYILKVYHSTNRFSPYSILKKKIYIQGKKTTKIILQLTISSVCAFTNTAGNSIISWKQPGGFGSSHVASKSITMQKSVYFFVDINGVGNFIVVFAVLSVLLFLLLLSFLLTLLSFRCCFLVYILRRFCNTSLEPLQENLKVFERKSHNIISYINTSEVVVVNTTSR